ncbi:cenp-O kinetochore centromere component [Xylaria bambusicola]|uniref:cenp-O kinetochore centromere component n=1 Tax=Xylaria bambusicola TaxID=326684 RepID=UPI0020079268|nr:cenp-O kinetochore centromere component [Xylaria bambusicola]KAI0522130.1 cenp-O kinetochore centromere component [Xylaria bambusicola]
MDSSRISTSPELSVADRLHDEIAKLRAQVESLKNDVKLQTATLMTANSTRELLQSQVSTNPPSTTSAAAKQKLLARFQEQTAHKQQCLYRACATITTFKVKDPDPNAVDGGNVLGLRFEVMVKGKFIRPYYVMLNRPYANRRHLRVHRHTVPQCIPLSGLTARYLPLPATKDDDIPKEQDLSRFARALRRELVRYHNRAALIGDMKKAAGLSSKKALDQEPNTELVDISAADAEAKQISLQWRDGRSGRLVMNDDGEVVKMIVQGNNGQDRGTVRQFLGGAVRVEEVNKQLESR